MIAILAGFLFVQALNIVRIISFFIRLVEHTVFEWFLYLWPVLIMLDVLIVFAIYLQWLGKQYAEAEGQRPDAHAPSICADTNTDADYVWYLVCSWAAVLGSGGVAVRYFDGIGIPRGTGLAH